MGLSTRELPDPHWLPWCDSSLTGFRLTSPPCAGSFGFSLHEFHPGPPFFGCVFVNTTEPQRVSAHTQSRFMCLEFLRSSSNADRLMGRSATFWSSDSSETF